MKLNPEQLATKIILLIEKRQGRYIPSVATVVKEIAVLIRTNQEGIE